MIEIKHHPPTFTDEAASIIAYQTYDLKAEASLLEGEHDQNFYLKTPDGHEFILKISHSAEDSNILDLQNQALLYLAEHAPTLNLPKVCPTNKGELITKVESNEGTTHLVRLLTYLPGKLLAEVKPHTPEILYSLGQFLGDLDCTLRKFSHPMANRTLKWDLLRADWISEYTHYITNPDRRVLVENLLVQYQREVSPKLGSLPKSIIHNDANDYNILVGNSAIQQSQVTGLIDFGDMVYTATVCELAIGITYAILAKTDPLTAAATIVAGYNAVFPLSEAELAMLFPLILTRLAVSVTNSAYQQVIDPANQYLQISEQPAWELLEKLITIPSQFAYYTFRQACGLPACPTTTTLEKWLLNNPDKLGRVVEPDLRTARSLVFDLSIGSLDLGNWDEFNDTPSLTTKLFSQMQAVGAKVGVGKYNEARPIYTTDMFKIEGNNGPEWRTVHLGLDLFMEAGSPVFTPLDGTVYSLCNNTALLDYGPTVILQHTIAEEQLTFYTLYGHLSLDTLDGLQEGQSVARGTQIAKIGNYPENGNWPPHLHFQIITDMLGRKGEFPGVALPNQREIWLSISPDPNLILGIPAEKLQDDNLSIETILEERKRHLGKNLSISYRKPLKIVRGHRQYLYDEDGRAYLDAVNNVPHVGHNHPQVVRAGQRQMAVLNTNTRYLHNNLVRYAQRICATLPDPLSVCYFVCSGSEANELALRLARAYSGQKDMVVIETGYHGNTSSLIEISSYKFDGPGGVGAPPYVHKVSIPDGYRGIYKYSDPQAGEKYAQEVALAINQVQQNGKNIAGFIGESILSCAGQVVLPDGYLKTVYEHVRKANGVCIADEVQTGFGRVGSHFWAFETQGVIPDIVTMGKPIGNGHPLAAVVTTPEIAAVFDNGMEYFNTFGGNPVSCAIGLAVLDVIEQEGLQANALKVGNRLLAGLRGLQAKYPIVGDVRGLGLFVGLELVESRDTLVPAEAQAAYVANRMRECGILLSTDGPYHNALKIKPPMVFDESNADFLVTTLDKILAEDLAQPSQL